jgi:pimeloyl-ACP methyl ester carboxylesterase
MKLIFVHGAGNTGFVWYYQTKYFPGSDAVSLVGHPEGQPCTSVEDYAVWLRKYIHDHGYSEPVIVGHSMGGAVAQTYALKYPGEVKGLILVGSGARLRVRPDFINALKALIDAPPGKLREFEEMLYGHVAPEIRDMVLDKIVEVGARVFLSDFQACDKFDTMDTVHQIKAPALVICGTQDDMTPLKYSHYLVDKISGARLVAVQGASHMVFLEMPQEVNTSIEEFIKRL